jgi:CelD/BcsL family acetyltransferase involved in cellulose biosynthesis
MRPSAIDHGMPSLATLADATREAPERLTVEWGASLAELAPQWEALADASGAAPFLRPRWFAAWERAFAPRGVDLLAVRRAGQLAAVLPVHRRSGSVRGAANDHTPVFGAVTADDGAARRLADALVERRRSVDLPFADPRAPEVVALLAASAAAGHQTVERSRLRQPYVALDGCWADYERALARKLRKESARLRRRLGELGSVTFQYDDGGDRLHETLSEGFAVEGSGWKTARGTAIASSPGIESFYRSVAEWAAERGWLRLAFLRVDGRPAAFDLCLEANGVVYALKGGFDPELRSYGPGMLLVRETLMHAFERGLDRYEFLGADDPYKLAWTDTAHERVRLVTYPPTLRDGAQLLGERVARPLARRLVRAVRRH